MSRHHHDQPNLLHSLFGGLKVVLIVLGCGLLITICINELSARGIIKPNPLIAAGLTKVTWQNILAGPQTWSTLVSPPVIPSTLQPQVNALNTQLQTVAARSGQALNVAQGFVKTQIGATKTASSSSNSAVQTQASKPAVHEQALEYAKYLYCQQVVEEYKKQHPGQ